MPITKSAKKALRQNKKRYAVNTKRQAALKAAVKKYQKLASTDKKEAEKFLSSLYQTIDKSAKNNIISRNRAARMKSRLTKKISTKAK
jgi:small subunit ribosomal protein S20